MTRHTIPAAITIAVLALAGGGSTALAKQGADDPPGHDANDDKGGLVHKQSRDDSRARSRDDRGRHGRHGRHHRRGGHDDGPNHR
jgi:hypothetical protein